jgi:peptidoglycan/xylan/chitin deacetylase (PgdA/CDA1 family)
LHKPGSLSKKMATTFFNKPNRSGNGRAVLSAMASALWYVPGRFGIARILGRSYSLRCVVFHDVSASESAFTRGMGVSITPTKLEIVLQFLAKYYNPVSLQDVLDDRNGRTLPSRAVLVTFDDGYASVMKAAIPVCQRLGVPAVLFLNAAVLNNERLSTDNLVCYVANTLGMETINAAARAVKGDNAPKLARFMDVFGRFFPSISLDEREGFLKALIDLGRINERQIASKAGLYLSSKQVSELSSANCEVGNHTRSHVHCRTLAPQHFREEIDRNKAELEALSGKAVRSFSVPYGSSADLSTDFAGYLRRSGHELIFLSEAVANPCRDDRICFDRVGPRAHDSDKLFLELELLPRLRKIRNWMNSRDTVSQALLHS